MSIEQPIRCRKCEGTTRVETAIDLHTGLTVRQYVCFSCGRRWCSDCTEKARSASAAA